MTTPSIALTTASTATTTLSSINPESVPNEWIAYTDWYNFSLDLIHTSGRGRRSIINQLGYYNNPAWSPDGQWIAFILVSLETITNEFNEIINPSELIIARPDGGDSRHILTTNEGIDSLSWSPMAKILYIHFPNLQKKLG